MIIITDMTAKEILNDFKENYGKVRKLLDEDSKNDPEAEPYLSKYKARDILSKMGDVLRVIINSESDMDRIKLHAMLGVVMLNIGMINMDVEEITAAEKVLTDAMELLTPNAGKPEMVTTMVNIYNHLGVLWANRDEHSRGEGLLLQAKQLYESFKCTLQMPLSIEHIISNSGEAEVGDFILLEKAHTFTLYYIAQVYGAMKETMKSAIYCHATLKRQLHYSDYEEIDWALNSATLSQFFAELNGFYQSRYHLAAASAMLEKYETSLMATESNDEVFLAKLETLKHRSADVARCWAKYCLLLMIASKERLMSDSERSTDAITGLCCMFIISVSFVISIYRNYETLHYPL